VRVIMGDLEGARMVTTTGQSGNPTDPHDGDLIEAWPAGRQVPPAFGPAAVQKAAVARLTLTP
jgi:penicillin amidase